MDVCMLGSGKSRSGQGCGFVRFTDIGCAKNAVAKLSGQSTLRPGDDQAFVLQVRVARDSASQQHATASLTLPIESRKRLSSESPIEMAPDAYSIGGVVKLFVGCLPPSITVQELHHLFASSGISFIADETHVMTGKSTSGQCCAFVFVHPSEVNKAIDVLDGRAVVPGGIGPIRVRVAETGGGTKRFRAMSADSTVSTAASSFTGRSAGSSTMRFFPPAENPDWSEPSVKTYHHYTLMPQSPHYGPLDIVPGEEPWRKNACWPPAARTYPVSFSFGQPIH